MLKVKVSQSYPTRCDPVDYTIHGVLQARILEWVAFPFTRGSSQPRDWTQVSCIAGGFFTSWATRGAQIIPLWVSKCVCLCFQSCLTFVTSWTVAHEAPLPVGCSRQEYWSGVSFPSPGLDNHIKHWKINPQVGRCPIYYWRRVEK